MSPEERHDQERALRRLAGVEDRHEALHELGEETPLPVEPLERSARSGVEEHLDGHDRAVRGSRTEDGSEAAASDSFRSS